MKLPWVSRKAVADLQKQLDDFMSLESTGVRLDGTGMDMAINGRPARVLAGLWVDFFHQNGGDNFVTMEMRVRDPWWKVKGRKNQAYEVTVQRVGGESPAEQLTRIKAENKSLREALEAAQ